MANEMKIADIEVGERSRREYGDIPGLARSIEGAEHQDLSDT